jgi:YkoY family integral membrane protein
MLGQVFELSDIPTVGALTFLETLLSADNAIVLGIISSALPEKLQKRALFIGLFSAFVFRAVAIFFVSFLLKYPLIQVAGGAYLLYLSIRHFVRKKKRESLLPTGDRSFWKTVFLIELFDIAFAVDSIVAGIAFINTAPHEAIYHPKLWIVYTGGMMGVCTIRYAAHFFALLNQHFTQLEMSAYLIIGWIGIKLTLQAFDFSPPYFSTIFWSGLIFLFCIGFIKKKQAT